MKSSKIGPVDEHGGRADPPEPGTGTLEEKSVNDVGALICELQIHNEELEIRNEELNNRCARLEKYRTWYSDLYDLAPFGYLVLDENGFIKGANSTIVKQLGVKRDSIVDKAFTGYMPRKDRILFREYLKEIYRTKDRAKCTVELLNRSGNNFYAHLDTMYIGDLIEAEFCRTIVTTEAGIISKSIISEAALSEAQDKLETQIQKHTTQIGSMSDALLAETQEHMRTEKALHKSEENYRELVENANSIILRLDTRGYITFFNEFAQRFFGYSEEEILGRNVIGTIVPETESSGRNLRKMIGDILRYPERYVKTENENTLRNGDRVWVLWTNKGLFDDNGRMEGVLWVGSDITARREAEEALRLDESRLEALLELSQLRDVTANEINDFVLRKIIELTKSKLGWLGFVEEGEAVIIIHVMPGNLEEPGIPGEPFRLPIGDAGSWAEAVRDGNPVIVNNHSSYANKEDAPLGDVPLSRFMSIPVHEGDRVVAVAVAANKGEEYDSSDFRQLSLLIDGVWKIIEREKSQRALREAESLSAMGRSLAGVAHDMKTPLIAIGGFTRLVRGHMEENSADREKLDIVIAETRRMENMVSDMLHFARPLELRLSPGDINRVVREILTVLQTTAQERGVKVISRLSPDLPSVSVDEMRMKQVIINLVMNAVQASPEGATVTVCSYHKGANAIMEVADQGNGIPQEKREEIFFPFISTKTQGTGLGLSIVKKIVDAHGGEVKILDNPEKGIIFRVLLPCP